MSGGSSFQQNNFTSGLKATREIILAEKIPTRLLTNTKQVFWFEARLGMLTSILGNIVRQRVKSLRHV